MVLGKGFVLSPEEAQALIAKNSRNGKAVVPYLNGEDLNTRPDQSAPRYVINFQDWPLDRVATDFPEALALIELRVKPERLAKPTPVANAPWWQFWRPRFSLYRAISGLRRVIVRSRLSKYNAFVFVDPNVVFADGVVVFPFEDASTFATLQSFAHDAWFTQYATLPAVHSAPRYVPADCFETFPFPPAVPATASIGEQYHGHRASLMLALNEGLTQIYNRVHARDDMADSIQMLRDLQVQMDRAVADAYGWDDIRLNHGFDNTEQGVRFTVTKVVRSEVLDRLLELNHHRHAEEVRAGLHEKALGSMKAARRAKDMPSAGGGRR
jgi:hypothetical protein